MERASFDIPATLIPFASPKTDSERNILNAMLIYPAIHSGKISHGRAAEILGLKKFDLIKIYSDLGFPYFDLSADELNQDLLTIKKLREEYACRF